MLLFAALLHAGTAREAWGRVPVVDVTLARRAQSLDACGLEPDRVDAILAEGREVAGAADTLRREGDARLRAGRLDVEAVARHNDGVAALAAREAERVGTLAGDALPCVLDALDAGWRYDRARGTLDLGGARRETRTVTCEVYATQFDANTSDEVAIPDYCIKFANLGWETCSAGYAAPPYVVDIARGGWSTSVWVGDVGPWNIDDNYWNEADDPDRPRRLFRDLDPCWNEARAAYYDDYNGGLDQYGRSVSNPAGLDLAVEVADQLGLAYLENDWVDLTFPWETEATWPALSLGAAHGARADQPADTRAGAGVGGDGVPDMYVGQEWTAQVVATNGGDARAEGTTLGFEAPAGLTVTRWDVYTDDPYADATTWRPSDANDNPANPAHDAPGAAFVLAVNGLAPGESKLVELGVRATAGTHPAELRAWVAHVDGVYEKAGWDGAPTNVEGSQGWNGGDLRVAAPVDVWPAQTTWAFDDGTADGWWAANALTLTNPGGHLVLGLTAADPQVVSGWFEVHAGAGDRLSLLLNNGTTGTEGRLYWAGEDGVFDEARALPVALPTTAGWHTVEVPVGSAAGWTGVVTRLRLDPPEGAGNLLVDQVVLDAASAAGDDTGLPAAQVRRAEGAGCGCGGGGPASTAGVALAGGVLVWAGRRRAPEEAGRGLNRRRRTPAS